MKKDFLTKKTFFIIKQLKTLKILNNLKQKRDRENLNILFYRQFFMLHPKKSILQVKIQRLRNNCRHVASFKLFLCRKCALKIWRGTYCVAGRHNCGFWLTNRLVQTNIAPSMPRAPPKTQLYFSKPKQAKSQAKNGRALN